MQILCYLRNDARTTNSEIAETLDISEATVRRRIRNMQERKIILGFSALINVPAIENSIKVFLHIKLKPEKINEVAETILKNPRIITLYRLLEQYELVGEGLFISMAELQEFKDTTLKAEGIESSYIGVVAKAYKTTPWMGL
jgi:DNA-binding Lrp family transcriptional regulator